MQLSWVIGSSNRPNDDQALPYREWEWAAAITSGRAMWSPEWIAKAAWLTAYSPWTISPVWLTSKRSEARMWLNGVPKGFTQKQSVCSGSRTVMWPATPSLNPKRPKIRKAAARRSLRCRRSDSRSSKVGMSYGMGLSERIAGLFSG